MVHRLLIGAAGLVAGTLVATPAVLGLSGNSSFSRDIQVPVPSGAHLVQLADQEAGDDHGTTAAPVSSSEDRPGHDLGSRDARDDDGGLRGSGGPGRGGADDGLRHDVGDDHGGPRGGDDRRGSNSGRDSGSDDRGHG
jgi:hypothetical protein